MGLFPRRVVLKSLTQACGRSPASAAFFLGLRKREQQLDAQGRQVVAAFRAPVLVAILWKKLAPVRRERALVARDVALSKSTLREALEVIRVDPHTLRVERDHRIRQ